MMTTTSAAAEFRSLYDNAADLMTALDAAGIPSEQDWANERTVWTFDDGSQISVSCGEIEVTPTLSCERTISEAAERGLEDAFDPA